MLGTLDDEILTCMADSGCTYVSLGIESGDEQMLKEMKKPLVKITSLYQNLTFRKKLVRITFWSGQKSLEITMEPLEILSKNLFLVG